MRAIKLDMKVTAVKTHKITLQDKGKLFGILDSYLPEIKEGMVVVVTSKIVAICEGRVARHEDMEKDELIAREAEWYLPRSQSKFNVLTTIKDGILNFSSGIDESNGNGLYILWPSNPQEWANKIREHLVGKRKIKNVGVIITDTGSIPLRRGQKGFFIAHSGFAALKSYIGEPDIFGRQLMMTKSAIADALATTAVLIMGEGNEQTPLAAIEDVPFVEFQQRNPAKEELAELKMAPEDDLYGSLLTSVKWLKGGQ